MLYAEVHTIEIVAHGLDHRNGLLTNVDPADRLILVAGNQIRDISIDAISGERSFEGVPERMKHLSGIVDPASFLISAEEPAINLVGRLPCWEEL